MLRQYPGHVLLGLLPSGGDRPLVVLHGGNDLRTGEQEHHRQSQQGEVHTEALLPPPGNDAVDCGDQARQHDGQRHPFMGGIGVLIDPLGLGRSGKPVRQLRIAGEEGSGLFQLLPGRLCLRRQHVQIPDGFLLCLPGKALLRLNAVQRQTGTDLRQIGQQIIHIVLPLEGALLLRTVTVFYHQVRNSAKDAVSGETALAHGDPLEYPADIPQRHIVVPVKQETVQIQRFFPYAAGAEVLAVFNIRSQDFRRQGGAAETHRRK